jgi:predicted dehydrogenase
LSGATLATGFRGGSPDFEKSASRVDGFTRTLVEEFGVEMLDSPEAVAEASDAILLTSVDGRRHLEQFARIAPYRRPTFIDKPFAVSSADAGEIARLAREAGTPLLSASSLRFAEALSQALDREDDPLFGADFTGPMPIEPTQGVFFWYGVHLAEGLYQVMGTGCQEVQVTSSRDHDVAVGLWKDGRIGTIRGFRNDRYYFRGVLHRESGDVFLDLDAGEQPKHFHLLVRVLDFFRGGPPAVTIENTLEVIRFLEAADRSRRTGERVRLQPA